MINRTRKKRKCVAHFSHDHNLALSEDVRDEKQCDGCSLFISNPYYFCSKCDFFLHKSCAELPLKKHIWFRYHHKFHRLTSTGIFKCSYCLFENSGFAYVCDECEVHDYLRCSSISDFPNYEGHKHLLSYYSSYRGRCNGCSGCIDYAFRCKSCHFKLCSDCLRLPIKVQHKSDDHLYTLIYHDNSSYSECYYCDIYEKERELDYWFYHCSICDNSAHQDCVIGDYSFIKLGSIYSKEDLPHPLTFVQKVRYYPECCRCGKPCIDLALECKEDECNYIAYWVCIKPAQLRDAS